MRERTRVHDDVVKAYEQRCYEGVDGCTVPHENFNDWYVSHAGDAVVEAKTEIMHDIVTPNFHRLSSEGKIINSPMDKTITVTCDTVTNLNSSHEFEFWAPGCTIPVWKRTTILREGSRPAYVYTGGLDALPAQPTVNKESLIAQAVTQAHANVSLTEAQGLVMIGEGRKTVTSLISIFARLVKIIKRIKRLDLYRVTRDTSRLKNELGFLAKEISGKELANRYMEVRYALRPLMYDVRDVAKIYFKVLEDAKDRATFRGFASNTAKSDSSSPYVDSWTDICGLWERHATIVKYAKRSVEVRAGVLTEVYGSHGTAASWGMFEPVEALWELFPLSFLVDWVFNVGDTIASFTPNYGLRELSSWYTVIDTTYREVALIEAHGHKPAGDATHVPNYINFSLGDCVTSQLVTEISRVPNPQRQVYPSLSLNLDMLKLVDAILIAKQFWH